MVVVARQTFATYDDSWQTNGNLFDLKCRSLRHERVFRISVPDAPEIVSRGQTCAGAAAISGLIAAASGPGAVAVATAAFTGCMGATVGIDTFLGDESHWTDWHYCF